MVAIDEGQFFMDLVESVLKMVNKYTLHVIVAGLNGDYQQHPFGRVHELLPHVDDLQFCRAYCSVCQNGTLASFTQRVSGGDAQVEVGSSYQSVCRACLLA